MESEKADDTASAEPWAFPRGWAEAGLGSWRSQNSEGGRDRVGGEAMAGRPVGLGSLSLKKPFHPEAREEVGLKSEPGPGTFKNQER